VGGSQRTTVAIAKGSPRRATASASASQSVTPHAPGGDPNRDHSVTPCSRRSFQTLAGVMGMST
jgi:hypothetical protein